jgi:hypothetical protein
MRDSDYFQAATLFESNSIETFSDGKRVLQRRKEEVRIMNYDGGKGSD